MIINERDTRRERALEVANKLMNAARTAPKTRGVDILEVAVITDEEIKKLSDLMLGFEYRGSHFKMERDSANILQAECIVLIGTKERPMGLNCGHCGFSTCASRTDGVPCSFNGLDVGIALGSATAMAADLRVDTRIMYSAGLAAQKLNYMKDCSIVMAIPISISSKNPFFDRVTKK